MRKAREVFVITLVVTITLAILSANVFGQGNTAVLFDGSALLGKTNFFVKNFELNKMEAKSPLFPGVEVRFNNNGRVSFGLGYQRWNLKNSGEHVSVRRPDDVEIVHFDKDRQANASVLMGTVYINLVTRGQVRPFIAFGGGYAPFNRRERDYNIVYNPVLIDQAEIDFQLANGKTLEEIFTPPPITTTGKTQSFLVKGLVGAAFYPTKHLVFSLAGGYINGPAVDLGFGFTF